MHRIQLEICDHLKHFICLKLCIFNFDTQGGSRALGFLKPVLPTKKEKAISV